MLSDDEHQALREIARRMRWESPELVRLLGSEEPQVTDIARQRARTRALLAAAAITGCVLLAPRTLTETEVRSRQRAPLPRTAAFDTTIARRTDPVLRPAALSALIEVAA
ncbi:DUF3040 domain-containing protein [Mycolicibacterium tusciae]|uniref:DUF3040 domain-containing protein n=1 Tax=Mycolicibacterium tusciae TaxID=75922 RepID=UPI00024A359C|nr:DUF3040 domain-containing protein [Mycolicibacterium tusciae]